MTVLFGHGVLGWLIYRARRIGRANLQNQSKKIGVLEENIEELAVASEAHMRAEEMGHDGVLMGERHLIPVRQDKEEGESNASRKKKNGVDLGNR